MVTKTTYEIDQSPLFKLGSKKRLAKLLRISQRRLIELSQETALYHEFVDISKKTLKSRDISAPRADLKLVQSRIDSLLRRIAPPDYLFCPVKGRSYVDNAARHLGSSHVKLLDIAKFYPNCKSVKVFWFFNKILQCPSDIAGVLVKLTCFKNRLPTGSPCSPVLGYLAYIDMWSEIEVAVKADNCLLSVYVDDITISGENVPGELVWSVKRILHRHGHSSNSSKELSKYLRPAEITGVIVSNGKLCPPNRQRQKLSEIRELRDTLVDGGDEAFQLDLQIIGRRNQIQQIVDRRKRG